jgi:hypothetical protein
MNDFGMLISFRYVQELVRRDICKSLHGLATCPLYLDLINQFGLAYADFLPQG